MIFAEKEKNFSQQLKIQRPAETFNGTDN